jgi:hypothetical protein
MILVSDLDQVATARLEDAKALLVAGRPDGAIYLCGYAIEIALKARICRQLNWPAFPSTRTEFAPLKSFQTHNLDTLLQLSGQEAKIKQALFPDWNVVSTWNPEFRYDVVGKATPQSASSMIDSVVALMGAL